MPGVENNFFEIEQSDDFYQTTGSLSTAKLSNDSSPVATESVGPKHISYLDDHSHLTHSTPSRQPPFCSASNLNMQVCDTSALPHPCPCPVHSTPSSQLPVDSEQSSKMLSGQAHNAPTIPCIDFAALSRSQRLDHPPPSTGQFKKKTGM
jgi:hypothetical protein